jgi:hypothetical protein
MSERMVELAEALNICGLIVRAGGGDHRAGSSCSLAYALPQDLSSVPGLKIQIADWNSDPESIRIGFAVGRVHGR